MIDPSHTIEALYFPATNLKLSSMLDVECTKQKHVFFQLFLSTFELIPGKILINQKKKKKKEKTGISSYW